MTVTRASSTSPATVGLLTLLLAAVPLSAQEAPPELLAERVTPEVAAALLGPRALPTTLRLEILPAVRQPGLDPPALGADARQRNDALLNGALITLGAMGIFDNVVNHWILELHRAIPGPYTLQVEIGLVAASTALLLTGLRRERQARRR